MKVTPLFRRAAFPAISSAIKEIQPKMEEPKLIIRSGPSLLYLLLSGQALMRIRNSSVADLKDFGPDPAQDPDL